MGHGPGVKQGAYPTAGTSEAFFDLFVAFRIEPI